MKRALTSPFNEELAPRRERNIIYQKKKTKIGTKMFFIYVAVQS
jgi:hypothetical protein